MGRHWTTPDVEDFRDPLFDDAVRLAFKLRRIGVSAIQRSLLVGYARASRLMDQMVDAGAVEHGDIARRQCLIMPTEYMNSRLFNAQPQEPRP
jgi:DNA segregation ATPase FtsK/SpoIIIE-like protein